MSETGRSCFQKRSQVVHEEPPLVSRREAFYPFTTQETQPLRFGKEVLVKNLAKLLEGRGPTFPPPLCTGQTFPAKGRRRAAERRFQRGLQFDAGLGRTREPARSTLSLSCRGCGTCIFRACVHTCILYTSIPCVQIELMSPCLSIE